ncbi:MAG TPA: hypothetical protein VK571_11385 [Gemmatimonadaceae bacterium]|nr:hypothetical protein [Gemmatimonadaceae bacterium]
MKICQYLLTSSEEQVLWLLPSTQVLGAFNDVRPATGTIQVTLGVLEPSTSSPRVSRLFRCFYPNQEVPDGYQFVCVATGGFTGYIFELTGS